MPTAATAAGTRPGARRRKRRPWGLLVVLVLVAGAIGGYVVWSNQEDEAEEHRQREAAAAPSKLGKVYPATAEGSGFHWSAPRSEISHGWTVPVGFAAAPPETTYVVHRYGDFQQENEDPRQVFDVRAFPASVGATDASEETAFSDFTGRPESPKPETIEVAGAQGRSFRLQSERDGMSADDDFPFEIRVVAVQIDGAMIVVMAEGQGDDGVDDEELDRLLDSIVYDPEGPEVEDRAGAEGAKALPDAALVDVVDAGTGFRWRSPATEPAPSGVSTAAASKLDDFVGYRYEDGFTTYEVDVFPASTGATAEDQARAADYFLGNHTILSTEAISIAGREGIVVDAIYRSDDQPQQVLLAAAAIDGAYLTIEAYRSDMERPNEAEFERLVASITRG